MMSDDSGPTAGRALGIIPLFGMDMSFDVDLLSLLQVLGAVFSGGAEAHHPMPFGLGLSSPGGVHEAVFRRQSKRADRL